jgi:hypothetical protein
MTDTPEDWVLLEAAKRIGREGASSQVILDRWYSDAPLRALCDMITKHEQKPVRVPEGQTPLDRGLTHRLLDVIKEGEKARDTGASNPYHGHSLEHCLHATGWVQRDLRIALDKERAKHEKPPIDRKLLCAEDAWERTSRNTKWTYADLASCAIELFEEGFGK